jgi:hypothetical protein
MADAGFDFQKFIAETKDVLISPKSYFASMQKSGGLLDPIVRAAIFGVIAGVFSFLWGLLIFNAFWAFGAGAGVTAIIFSPIFAVIGLFIGGIIILIISAISGGSTDFETNLRVSASLMVLYPIQVLLMFTYGINIFFGAVLVLLFSLYGIWLLFNALVFALSAKESVAKIIMIVLAIFPVLGIINTIACHSTYTNLSNQMMQGPKDQEEAMKQANKLIEMMKKQQQQQ